MKAFRKTISAISILAVAILVAPSFAEKSPVQSLKVPALKQPTESTPQPNPSTIQEKPSFPIAVPHINDYGVEWHPHGEEIVRLSVSVPDGTVFQATFPSDTLPHFDFHDEYGELRPNGTYAYELKIIPGVSPETYGKMRSIQDSPVRDVILGGMKISGELPAESEVQTGAFSFSDHKVLMGDAVNMDVSHSGDADEASIQKDQVIPDDLIVQSSLCVGFDCVNNEDFGFDTIRLKENNTRIKFDDTSASAGFPSFDWQLTANDSASGGLNKFSIEDITSARVPFTIRGGARTNSLYVDDSGRIGVGTSNPAIRMQLVDGNTPGIRFDQDGSQGWGTHVWDLSGNEANFFLRDVTNGGRLVLRIRPGAPSNSLYIDANGNVGLGNASPRNRLDVEGGAAIGTGFAGSNNSPTNGLIVEGHVGFGTHNISNWSNDFIAQEIGGNSAILAPRAGGSYHQLNNAYFDGSWRYKSSGPASNYFMANGSHVFRVAGNQGLAGEPVAWTTGLVVTNQGRVGIQSGAPNHLLEVGSGGAVCNGTTWIDGSSRDYKKEIQELSNTDLDELMAVLDEVNVVSYLYKQDKDETPKRIGMIAEEMPEILSSEDRKGMELGRHVGFLMGISKALHAENKDLATDVEHLRAQVESLQKALQQLTD